MRVNPDSVAQESSVPGRWISRMTRPTTARIRWSITYGRNHGETVREVDADGLVDGLDQL